MKNIVKIITLVFMLILLLSRCTQPKSKSDISQEKTHSYQSDSSQILRNAQIASTRAEWNNFKQQADSTIIYLEKQISDLEVKMTKAERNEKNLKELNKQKEKLNKQKEKLENRNKEFEADLSKFDNWRTEKYDGFKKEFKDDMIELGNSFKDLFTKVSNRALSTIEIE